MPISGGKMLKKQDVSTRFKYLLWDDLYHKEKPFENLLPIPLDAPDQRRTNLAFQEGPEEIVHDVRGNEEDFSLDTNGFAYAKHHTNLSPEQFANRDMVDSTYLPECEQLLRSVVDGVDQVHFYHWRVRYSENPIRPDASVTFGGPTSAVGPAVFVHVDQSPASVVERVRLHLPHQADFLLRGRVRHINIWRPIRGPVEDWPLAVCDGRTIHPSNLLETDRIRREYAGCTLFSVFKKGFKWYYMSDQNDETLLFKSFDSKDDVTGYAAHASFPMPAKPYKLRPRESIEVRALVFTYPE